MDDRLDFPATGRNRDAIRDALDPRWPREDARVLEIASGSGQHLAHFAAHWPGLHFVGSDPDPAHRASIAAWCRGLPITGEPLDIDVRDAPWPGGRFDVVFCANMIHIAPFACTEALFANADADRLDLYGPFVRTGVPTAPSNVDFDASLRARDRAWGVRHLDDEVEPVAAAAGWHRDEIIEMPANNLLVTWSRRS